MKPQLTRLMKIVLELDPFLKHPKAKQAYEACELALKDKPKGKCLMRNSGVTVEDVRASLQGDLIKADASHYYHTALDWSDGDNQMRTDWVAVVRSMARRNLAEGKLKISKHVQDGGSNLGQPVELEPERSVTAMTYAEYKAKEKR